MKIFIIGSLHFAREIEKAKETLEKMGHEVILPPDTLQCVRNPEYKNSLDADLEKNVENGIKKDVFRQSFVSMEKCDAVLALNHDKNNIKGYIGASVLMELGAAYCLRKKIFLLKDIDRSQKYAPDVLMIQPTILEGEFSMIN